MGARQAWTRGVRLGWWDALIVVYVAILLAGAMLIAVIARQGVPSKRVDIPRRAALPWVVLALLVAGWELTALFWGNDSAHPTLEPAARPRSGHLYRAPGRLSRLACRRPVAGDPVTPYGVILTGFLVLLAAGLALEVLGRAPREPFRPLARVLEAEMTWPGGRWVVVVAWLWIGFHFLAR